eukprot:CAMPEP_0171323326 /NCGR_PEP_ID=MMETSP0816-20121228/115506_1 /TAXON_ID=420281 /ORGANISM="Proboscia inermis, Strain CCAP1064/1" /LENGTH=76 /DNA_ID=CAMNT_0011822007 /DNA_START=514 /DNA_END=740 /DNA_ORIENTATION=+
MAGIGVPNHDHDRRGCVEHPCHRRLDRSETEGVGIGNGRHGCVIGPIGPRVGIVTGEFHPGIANDFPVVPEDGFGG